MGYPTTVDTGLPAPAIITTDSVRSGSNGSTTFTSAAVYVEAFTIYAPTLITGARWHNGATAAGKTNMGIYTLAGNLVAGTDTGQVSNVVNSDVTFTYASAFTLSPGTYLLAFSPSAGTDTYVGNSGAVASGIGAFRIAANTVSGGALPATLGALSSTANMVVCSFLISGGL